jgi:hypothetical protein
MAEARTVLFAGYFGPVGGWFTMVVYRREVMPMQAELVESKTIIERQQKLAHFGELAAGLARMRSESAYGDQRTFVHASKRAAERHSRK